MGSIFTLKTGQQWRRSKYSMRPFVLTLLAVTLITALAFIKVLQSQYGRHSEQGRFDKRDISISDEECRLVHHSADQCAFVLANCPDEEAGMVSYLTLYYCRMPHAKPVAFVILVLWLSLLFSTIGIAASDFFCVNLNTIASMLGMSESLAGVTLLAFGNGSPDVFSTFAAFRTNAASLAVGELIGAACFITAVVSGSMALIRPFSVARRSFIRDVTFFLVAAAFSMGFIADGKLQMWESATMAGFYLFYVVFVVSWHWWLNQRKTRRQKAATMRSHYITPGGEEEEITEYHDDERTQGSRTPIRVISADDFTSLERAGGGGGSIMDEDDDEEERERWMGELTNNMRLNRPEAGPRRNTLNPIRPSLVGALEFRAVLSSLHKSRNIQSMPISLRRYSDDPNYATAQQQDYISASADPSSRQLFDVPPMDPNTLPCGTRRILDVQHSMGTRARAVSTGDVNNVRLPLQIVQNSTLLESTELIAPSESPALLTPTYIPPSPTVLLSPTTSRRHSRMSNPAPPKARRRSPNRLAPPAIDNQLVSPVSPNTGANSPLLSTIMESTDRPAPQQLKLSVPGATSPLIAFPAYTEYPWSTQTSPQPPSLLPRSPSASPESGYPRNPFTVSEQPRVPSWWPLRILPLPSILLSTLFPTLTNWNDKSFFDKFVGLVACVPVLLLTITLPVVESQTHDNETSQTSPSRDFSLPPPLTPRNGGLESCPHSLSNVSSPVVKRDSGISKSRKTKFVPEQQRRIGEASNGMTNYPPQVYITGDDHAAASPEQLPLLGLPSESAAQWNRWLVILQLFTAPLFIVLIFWANTEPDDTHALLRHALYSLVASLCVLVLVLSTTTPNRPPRWHTLLCFLGFVVSIGWISTIANEVVGVLRTLGVVFDISDAILGLTIFAVGNSLGDLVADITVARLGFPIMALSACFGGPMLNILLGIGLSGLYMTVVKGEHRHERHPDQPIRFKPYHISVSTTLVVAGATLLVTLLGLLVAVPMRKWRMDKMIGWGLVVLWGVSTLANVLVEVFGHSSNVS